VAYAEVSPRVHVTDVTPNDPCYSSCTSPSPVTVEDYSSTVQAGTFNQANLAAVHAPQAWGITEGNPNLLVAVLDTGVDASHPDLAGKVIVGPTLCYNSGDTCTSAGNDAVGHGTHVTGIIAANTNNGTGIAGLAWNVKVEMFKVLGDSGDGSDADVVTGIYDAVAAGARVINMSLATGTCGGQGCATDPDMLAAISYALQHGVVVVAAAGNDGSDIAEWPASYPGVLAVAATDNSGALANFSEYGYAANIAAPGVNILSTWKDGNYAILSGTSMATPEVSAAAALVLSVDPGLTAPQVASVLTETSAPMAGDPIDGGLLDVGAAVAKAAAGGISPDINGYTLAGADGSVYPFGMSPYYGSIGGPLNKPVVGTALTPGATGYWLVASDGGIFTFGDAGYYGSTGNIRLNKPVVGMAATPDGKGYWLVASDGGIFTFGDARYYGSTGNIQLSQPMVAMAATPDGGGYWLVASDGGVFTFGDATFFGSAGGQPIPAPVVGAGA